MSTLIQPVVVLIPGDLHLTGAGLANHDAALWAVEQANEFIRPDFVQFIGDNVQDARTDQFVLFRDLTERLRVPWYALAGDHDVKDDPTAAGFRNHVGAPTGSLSLRGFRFLRLNTQEARPVGLSPAQVAWLRQGVDAAENAKEQVVLFQHNYPYQIWEDYDGPGIGSWREVVQTRRISAILCGHTHYWQLANDGRNAVVATRSIGDPEGGRPGYTLAFFRGDDFAVTYRTVEDRGPLVLVTHPRQAILATGPAHVVKGVDEVRVWVWSASALSTVEGRIDGSRWFALHPASLQEYKASLPDSLLTKGSHQLTIRARAHDGGTGEQTIVFAVDPTGRYTAVPRVDPVVASTQFC